VGEQPLALHGAGPIRKVLIANRGEIALRIVRACREAGIASVAVYSEVDRAALHVRYADVAYPLGPPEPAQSYLNIARILEAAQVTGADAVHPGYGFLAENAGFALACEEAGLTFVGPPVEAIRLLGDKAAARRTMSRAGIPVVPGSDPVADPAVAVGEAQRLGFPLLVKAAGGGGGRGIRVVQGPQDLEAALEVASAEALQAFGDPTIYLERLLDPVRHVEVQIMADGQSEPIALGERECSIQRRHQKLIEEAPSPAVDERLRRDLVEAAVAAARATGYRSAGTVEFLIDRGGHFYFLEVNTRLQVEHPVTEMLTGGDLVRDQLCIAAGQRLSYGQADVEARGAAIECRILAEDPLNGFVPSTGRARLLREPGGPGIRLDSGLYDGLEVTPYYDSLLAKLIAWGRDREEAVVRMRRALDEYQIAGVRTVLPFHRHVLASLQFLRGELSTGFVDAIMPEFEEASARRAEVAALGGAVLAASSNGGGARAPLPGPPGEGARAASAPSPSPWVSAFRPHPWSRNGWR